MPYKLLDEFGPCRLSGSLHPAMPVVQYCQVDWMGDYRWNRKRCSVCLKTIPRRPSPAKGGRMK